MNEERHEEFQSRGEYIKFAVLVLILLVTILLVAAARPLIFDRIVPNVLGWRDVPAEPGRPTPTPVPASPASSGEETPSPVVEASPTPETSSTPAPTREESAAPDAVATPRLHVVQQGDNLTKIAERYGVSIEDLARANNLADRDRIYPGDRLIIP